LEFPRRAELAGHPELTDTLLALLGGLDLDPEILRAWLPAWEAAFLQAAAQPHNDPRIHTARLEYYKQALLALLATESPLACLWPLLHTWSLCAETGVLNEAQQNDWQAVLQTLGLDASGLSLRLQGLDHYLDVLEETLDAMTAQYDV
jgi:hypothetical protein